jgi:prepilin-type N-terminal cleavage/methylation domain-containing protein
MAVAERKGFTLLEFLVVIGVMGILLLAAWPNIMNTLETRSLENAARDILTSLQTAKIQSVSTKLNHRVRFFSDSGRWYFTIEREDTPGVWNTIPRFIRKSISTKFSVVADFPDANTVVFSPIGFVDNFNNLHKTVTLASSTLRNQGQPDQRIIMVYGGGSIRYIKSQSY